LTDYPNAFYSEPYKYYTQTLKSDFPYARTGLIPALTPGPLRHAFRIKHHSYSTEKTSVHWTKRSILFHIKYHPAEMGTLEIEDFLSYPTRKARAISVAVGEGQGEKDCLTMLPASPENTIQPKARYPTRRPI
jgi:hypothetical protein